MISGLARFVLVWSSLLAASICLADTNPAPNKDSALSRIPCQAVGQAFTFRTAAPGNKDGWLAIDFATGMFSLKTHRAKAHSEIGHISRLGFVRGNADQGRLELELRTWKQNSPLVVVENLPAQCWANFVDFAARSSKINAVQF